MPFSWADLIPIITGGAQAAGQIIGANKQNQGIQQAKTINTQGLNNAVNILGASYLDSQQGLAPYKSLTNPALDRLTQLTFRPGRPGGYTGQLPTFNSAGGGAGSGAGTGGSNALGSLLSGLGTGTGGTGLGSALPGGTATAGSLSNNFVAPSFGGQLASALGPIAGGLAGAGIGVATGAGLGAAMSGPLAPIGAAVGALVGPLIGHFTRKGREKTAASSAVNELSQIIWGPGGIIQAAKSGQITPDQATVLVKSNWNDYVKWLQDTLKDDGVVNNSIASQYNYLFGNNDLANALGIPKFDTTGAIGATGGGSSSPVQTASNSLGTNYMNSQMRA